MLSERDLLRPLPDNWRMIVGFDTGAYMSAVFVTVPPESLDLYVVQEFPNYHYVGGEIERIEEMSDTKWAQWVVSEYRQYFPHKTVCKGWVDENSQFKQELKHHKIGLRGNKRGLELRVEITREYFQTNHCHMAPWLKILPYELEHARWPDEMTAAGRFMRLKVNDHTLDCLEHALSRKPRSKHMIAPKKETFLQRYLRENRVEVARIGDPHLGHL